MMQMKGKHITQSALEIGQLWRIRLVTNTMFYTDNVSKGNAWRQSIAHSHKITDKLLTLVSRPRSYMEHFTAFQLIVLVL